MSALLPSENRPPSRPIGEEAVRRVRRVNRTWITRGNLAENTALYLDHLQGARPDELITACEKALQAASTASKQMADPKLPFYATLFSVATKEERNRYLKDHFFTRLLSAELQLTEN